MTCITSTENAQQTTRLCRLVRIDQPIHYGIARGDFGLLRDARIVLSDLAEVSQWLVSLVGRVATSDRCMDKTLNTATLSTRGARQGAFGGNVQAVIAPDGLPVWTWSVAPGLTHDLAAARDHALGVVSATSQLTRLAVMPAVMPVILSPSNGIRVAARPLSRQPCGNQELCHRLRQRAIYLSRKYENRARSTPKEPSPVIRFNVRAKMLLCSGVCRSGGDLAPQERRFDDGKNLDPSSSRLVAHCPWGPCPILNDPRWTTVVLFERTWRVSSTVGFAEAIKADSEFR